jgi:hypothetical protein
VPRPGGPPFPRRLELDICEAIARRLLLAFDYGGSRRVVQPYCHGFTRSGAETLRAVEVNARGRAFGKLWTVAKIQNLLLTTEPFTPDDPDYNPDDSAMAGIHCRVTRAQSSARTPSDGSTIR